MVLFLLPCFTREVVISWHSEHRANYAGPGSVDYLEHQIFCPDAAHPFNPSYRLTGLSGLRIFTALRSTDGTPGILSLIADRFLMLCSPPARRSRVGTLTLLPLLWPAVTDIDSPNPSPMHRLGSWARIYLCRRTVARRAAPSQHQLPPPGIPLWRGAPQHSRAWWAPTRARPRLH